MIKFPLPRLDEDPVLQNLLLKYCRLKPGEIWTDPLNKHKVGCLDVCNERAVKNFAGGKKASLAIQDPPYNMIAFGKMDSSEFILWCEEWIDITINLLSKNSALYIWLGADQKKHFEPFAEFILMMRDKGLNSNSFITLRNQRGYGTQKNWMSVRQELLYYSKGNPVFNTRFVYTEIPKLLKGYYKNVGGVVRENLERSKSNTIRAGNVWVDVQQVFHLMEENVTGCFAQKPLKAIERIINVSSSKNDYVFDFFAHAGTTLLGCERLNRKCYTIDINPIYCEISIRRLERFRETGKLGWQNSNPFEKEIVRDPRLRNFYQRKLKIKIPS